MKSEQVEGLMLNFASGDLQPADEQMLSSWLHEHPDELVELFKVCEFEAVLQSRRRSDITLPVIMSAVATLATQQSVAAVMRRLPPGPPARGARALLSAARVPLACGLLAILGAAWWATKSGDRTHSKDARAHAEATAVGTVRSKSEHRTRIRVPSTTGISDYTLPLSSQAPQPLTDTDVFSIDFEREELLTGTQMVFGVATTLCPPATHSKACALGGIHPMVKSKYALSFETTNPLHSSLGLFDQKRMFSFDYFIGASLAAPGEHAPPEVLVVQIKNREQQQNYRLALQDAVHGRWARALVKIVDLKPNVRRDQPIEDGDALRDFTILGGTIGRDPFFVDNIRFFEVGNGHLPNSTANAETIVAE